MSTIAEMPSTEADSSKTSQKVTSDVTTASSAKPKVEKKKKTKKKSKRRTRKPVPKTKVVVRRLPPNLPQDIFMNSVKPWTAEDIVTYSLYVPGKLSKSKAKESVFSRAYFQFKTMEHVILFHQGFDGHLFVDSRGNEYRAVVEFAPYQKVPKEHKTVDVRQGTIDQDQDYLDFLESLKAEENASQQEQSEPMDGLSQIERLENRIAMVTAKTLAAEQANKPKTTPLLEHLRAQKAAQAAAKAKAAAKKSARRKAEKQAKKTTEQPSSPLANTTEAGEKTEKKKRRDRGKKKESTEKTNSEDGQAKPRPPKEPKANKPRNKPSQEINSDSSKPKKPNSRRQNNPDKTNKPPQVVKILNRQASATPSSSSASSTK
ncbi:Regulator of nonsense transcripts UPF3 [Choanephora cucurbitarum]|uniref:Regulator of nonsense transcripts UPF3 n=1 Tax=Choanephora cucurbitarum TaxID=101091 RepID=A0A1C7N816_9FUNG|nr:Regulator of nonsense transcripts UPF3 [Choanephora cucurbitarum]